MIRCNEIDTYIKNNITIKITDEIQYWINRYKLYTYATESFTEGLFTFCRELELDFRDAKFLTPFESEVGLRPEALSRMALSIAEMADLSQG